MFLYVPSSLGAATFTCSCREPVSFWPLTSPQILQPMDWALFHMPSLFHFPLQGTERYSKLPSHTILTFCRNNHWDSNVGAPSLLFSLQIRLLPHNYPSFTSVAHFIFCPLKIHASFTSSLYEPRPVLTTLLVQCRTNIIPPSPSNFYWDASFLVHVVILHPCPIV